jgi:hypothetical protein
VQYAPSTNDLTYQPDTEMKELPIESSEGIRNDENSWVNAKQHSASADTPAFNNKS